LPARLPFAAGKAMTFFNIPEEVLDGIEPI
jgi:hypothetical protein